MDPMMQFMLGLQIQEITNEGVPVYSMQQTTVGENERNRSEKGNVTLPIEVSEL